MDLNTYRTFMIGHMLDKLDGAIMEAELNDYMETLSLRALEEAVIFFQNKMSFH